MSTPFNTSLRRDPDDPRGLGERIEALIRERIEEAVEFIAMDLLVQLRRAHGRPALEAGSPGDRAEFQELVQDLLRHLRRECSEGLAPDALGKVSQAEVAQGREELARLLAGQTALARLLPDYWQRFEVSKGDFARARLTAPPPRASFLARLFRRSPRTLTRRNSA